MSIDMKNTGAYEREVEQNWAAAYAKRLVEELELKHDEDKRLTDQALESLDAAVDQRATKTELDDAVDLIEGELEHYASLSDLGEEAEARSARDNALADGTGLENNCIYSRHIREGNVTTGKIHDGDVTGAKLATGAVTAVKLAEGAVTEGKIAAGAVTASKINDGAVSSLGLADNCVTTDKLGTGAVTEGKIASGAVTEGKLASNAVTAAKIKNNEVTNSKLASDVFASGTETGYGQSSHIAVTPLGLKQGIGGILPASVSYGDFGIDNIPCDSLDADVTSIFGNPVLDAGLRNYSTTPQLVGTWVDGTPIWRLSLPYIRIENGVRGISLNSSLYHITSQLSMILYPHISSDYDTDYCPIIHVSIYSVTDAYSSLNLPSISNGLLYFCNGDDNAYADLTTTGKWGGYLDFVCPSEYIVIDTEGVI